MTSAPPRSSARLDGIDLLRGLALFFVLMNHVNMQLLFAKVPYTKGLPPQLTHSLVWNGQFGVQIFFAISGFLITSTALRRWSAAGRVDVPRFYLLRFARIAPLLLALLAVLSILHLAHVRGFIVSPKTGGLPRALLAALTFHINVLEARRDYLPGSWDILWSLSVEEIFYFAFPLLCRIFGRGRWLAAILTLFVALGPFARTLWSRGNPVWREYSYLGGMDAIALGCLTALLLFRVRLNKPAMAISTTAGAALLLFSLAFSITAYKLGLGRNGLNMTILAVGTCMLLAAAAQSHWTSPRLLAPLRNLGRRSYEVYLTHMFIVIACARIFIALGKPMRGVPLLFAAVFLFAGILGTLIARFYTEPINAWIRNR